MSTYRRLRTLVDFHNVEVGWESSRRSYFVRAYDTTGMDVAIQPRTNNLIYERGVEDNDRLSTLYDLMTCTWSLVEWSSEIKVLEQLAVDPFLDVHRALSATIAEKAAVEGRRELRELLGLVYGQPLHVELPATRAVRR